MGEKSSRNRNYKLNYNCHKYYFFRTLIWMNCLLLVYNFLVVQIIYHNGIYYILSSFFLSFCSYCKTLLYFVCASPYFSFTLSLSLYFSISAEWNIFLFQFEAFSCIAFLLFFVVDSKNHLP